MPLDLTFQPCYESPVFELSLVAESSWRYFLITNHWEKKNKFSGRVKWLPKGLFAVDLWQMLDNKSMFKALTPLDSFIALSDS